MADTTDIIKALTWWNAERFKTLQRKLTTVKNTIEKEALSANFRPFFSDDEIKTLQEASRILGTAKRKIEHAKEIKAREEQARDLRLADYKRQRQALLAKVLPRPETEDIARSMLLWVLALSLHHQEINRHAYFYEQKYIASDIERVFGAKTSHTVLGEADGWRREVTQFLEENLWHYDEVPDPARLEKIEGLVQGEWGKRVQLNSTTHELIERFDTELTIKQSDSVHRI